MTWEQVFGQEVGARKGMMGDTIAAYVSDEGRWYVSIKDPYGAPSLNYWEETAEEFGAAVAKALERAKAAVARKGGSAP